MSILKECDKEKNCDSAEAVNTVCSLITKVI